MLKYQTIKAGDIIVSSPYVDKGMVFNKSVILIMLHDQNGTSGIIINKMLNVLKDEEIQNSLHLSKSSKNDNTIVKENNSTSNTLSVYFGGPIEQEKGIIIHNSGYKSSSVKLSPGISISTSARILKDIISNNGPTHKMLVLGYSGWSSGQLMEEIKRNDWLLLLDKNKESDSDSIFKLLFLEDPLYRWNYALELSGIKDSTYLKYSGNA